MLNAEMIMATILWPSLAAAIPLVFLLSPALRKNTRLVSSVSLFAVTLGFVVGYWGIIGAPSLSPPIDAKSRLPLVALLFFFVGLLRIWAPSPKFSWIASTLAATFSVKLIFAAAIEFQWSTTEAILRCGIFALGLLGLLACTSALRSQASERVSMAAIAGLAGLGAPLMLFSDSLVLAQLHGALGISAGVLFVAVSISPKNFTLEGVSFPLLSIAWYLWSIALLFANTPLSSFLLLSLALPLSLIVQRLVSAPTPRFHALTAVVPLAAMIVAALGIGALRYTSSAETSSSEVEADYGYGYDYE